MIKLLVAAVLLRAGGAALRASDGRAGRLAGWPLCTTALWGAAGGLGAWSPLWPAIVGGAAGAAVEWRRRSAPGRVALDVLVVWTLVLLSVPSLRPVPAIVAVVGLTAMGLVVDKATERLPGVGRAVALLAALLVVYGGIGPARGLLDQAARMESDVSAVSYALRLLPNLGVTDGCRGERVQLPGGAVAWLDRGPGRGPHPGALLFHGNDPRASHQAAACVLRRALTGAGYTVLAVDHPGYGASPSPDPRAGTESWDPLPVARAALRELRGRGVTDPVLAVGHSMGTSDVLRLLAAEPAPTLAAILGGALDDPPERQPYWYDRFHRMRSLDERVPWEKWREIHDRYYDKGGAAGRLSAEHPPVLFVTFGVEHANLMAGRGLLYRRIPGPRTRVHLSGVSHYFSTARTDGLILGDTKAARDVARMFAELRAGPVGAAD